MDGEPASAGDSLEQAVADSDSVVLAKEAKEVPEAVDEFFSDFIYSFTTNKAFQFLRVRFPLTCISGAKKSTISRSQWRYSKLYTKNQTYTVFFDSKSSMKLEKSRNIDSVVIERINMNSKAVRGYLFKKMEGKWMLTEINDYPLSKYKDAEFMVFYQKFATDTAFQQKHVAESVSFVTADPDDEFETMTGELDNDQWPSFRPELPSGVLSNIDYGQSLRLRNRRVLAIEGSSSGFMCILFFKKTSGGWMLYRFEN